MSVTILRTKGLLVCFTGIDGSGKTSNANKLIENLRKMNLSPVYAYGRWTPVFSYPFLAFFRLLRYSSKVIHRNKIQYSEKHYYENRAIAYTWLVASLVDLIVLNFFRVLVHIWRGKIVVCDRYVYDVLVDQMFDLRDSSLYLRFPSKLLYILMPKPQITFLMDLHEGIAFSRKKDTPTLEYLSIRRKLYLQLAGYFDFIVINAAESLSSIQEKVIELVTEK